MVEKEGGVQAASDALWACKSLSAGHGVWVGCVVRPTDSFSLLLA